MTTKEQLKEIFSDGNVPCGDDYAALIDALWHKSEMGRVVAGEEQPVSGGAVAKAIDAALKNIDVREQVEQLVEKLLTEWLERYVTVETLKELQEPYALRDEVDARLADTVVRKDLSAELSGKADVSALALKADSSAVTAALAGKLDAAAAEAYALKAEAVTRSELERYATVEQLAGKADVGAVTSLTAAVASLNASMENAVTMSSLDDTLDGYVTVTGLSGNATIQELQNTVNALVTRTNKLSRAACGSEAFGVCLSDIGTITKG